jgi:hypothetical protein
MKSGDVGWDGYNILLVQITKTREDVDARYGRYCEVMP